MVFPPGPIPALDHQLDNSTQYKADVPFNVKQSTVSHRRHRWFDVRDIGTPAGPYAVSAGLNAGAQQRIQYEHRPDLIIVSISGQTANTGRCVLYYGEAGGPFIRLGPLGKAIIPAPESGVITLLNTGTTATYGTVVAVAGMPSEIMVDIVCGS